MRRKDSTFKELSYPNIKFDIYPKKLNFYAQVSAWGRLNESLPAEAFSLPFFWAVEWKILCYSSLKCSFPTTQVGRQAAIATHFPHFPCSKKKISNFQVEEETQFFQSVGLPHAPLIPIAQCHPPPRTKKGISATKFSVEIPRIPPPLSFEGDLFSALSNPRKTRIPKFRGWFASLRNFKPAFAISRKGKGVTFSFPFPFFFSVAGLN